jgi:hypothetical protein
MARRRLGCQTSWLIYNRLRSMHEVQVNYALWHKCAMD